MLSCSSLILLLIELKAEISPYMLKCEANDAGNRDDAPDSVLCLLPLEQVDPEFLQLV